MEVTFTEIDSTFEESLKNTANAAVAKTLQKHTGNINIAICSDSYMLSKNTEVLKHNYYTDILTFFYHPENPTKEVELLISKDRVKDNAQENNVPFEQEFARVVIHGCLHLIGFDDQTESQKNEMRTKENSILKTMFHVEQ